MNKSKFLKKSLAMLLSVLMIVAMIPLGASAAESDVTDLQAIYINGKTVSVANKVFKADITSATTNTVEVRGLYTDGSGETANVIKADGYPVPVSNGVTTLTMSEYDKEGNVYTIPLVLTSADEENTAEYTIQLTVVSSKTSAELATVKATKAFSAKISGQYIDVQVPLGYDGTGRLDLTTKDNATIDGETPTGGVYTINTYDKDTTVVVRSQSGGNTIPYKVRLTTVPVLEEFQAGDVAAKITHDTTTPNLSVKATYPGTVLVKPDTEYDSPAKSMKTTFKVPAGTIVQMGKAADVSGDFTTGVITSGKSYDYLDADKYALNPKEYAFEDEFVLKVTCKDVTVTYTLGLNTEADTKNDIVSATVDGEVATVAGNKITANIQKGHTDADTVDVVLVSSPKAKINIQTKAGSAVGGELTAGSTDADGNGVFTATAATVEQLKEGLIVVVTSQAGKNKQYELKVTATGDVNTTELSTFALRIDGVTYKGEVNKTARTVAVTVPYLTTDAKLAAADVIATTNAYVKACVSDGGAVVTTGTSMGLGAFTLNTKKTSGTATGKVYAVAKSGSAPTTEYTVTVTLETAKTGNALSSLVATSAKDWKSLKTENTYTGKITTNADKSKTLTINPAYSECQTGVTTKLNLKSIATANGGVAFIGEDGGSNLAAVPGKLDDKKTTTEPAAPFLTLVNGAISGALNTIWVLPEIEARKELSNAGDAVLSKGTAYGIAIEAKAAQEGTRLNNLKLGTTTLGSTLTGTIPYGMTVEAGTTPSATNTYFADDFSLSLFAKLYFTKPGDETATIGQIIKGGDTNGDGAADAAGVANAKFFFERGANNTVKVSCWDGTTATEVTHLTVAAELPGKQETWPIGTIKYAKPNTDAFITAFSVAGSSGTIKNEGYDNWSIKVTVPLDTKLTNLVPTFTASAGASVTLGTAAGDAVKSGETSLDFTDSKVFVVTSEDKGKRNTYTVSVTVSDGFVDVPETAWYYNNVMAAYNAGYVSGTGNGKFEPTTNVTRRDFAVMVYNMLGKPAPAATTSFTDVRAEGYEVNAIAYLKEQDIVSGDDTGLFRPTDSITRQEAACILANAKNLTGTSLTTFTDDAKIASWAKTKVYACKAAGVISGDKDTGNFRPTDKIIRAEAATMVLNAASK